MGRVISGGGVFNPKIERRDLPQRVPIDESLARQYLSPRGIAQTASLIGSIPIPEAVSRYFMKEDKEPKEDGIAPKPTPAQEIASQRVGAPPVSTPIGDVGAGPTARERGRQLLRTRREITPREYEQALIARATETPGFAGIPDAQLASQLAPGSQTDTPSYDISREASEVSRLMRGAAIPGGLPQMHPRGDQETYRLQMQAVRRGLLSPQEFAASPGLPRPGTQQQAVIERLRTEFGGTPITTEERVMPTQEEYDASLTEEVTPEASPPSAPVVRGAAATDPRFQADFPEAPPVTKATRFEKAVADAGFDKFGGDMDFMRSVAKFADTEDEVKMVINAIDLVKVPPRTIGDLLTGAHKDRFRKEIMGLFPKLKAAPKPVSDLDKAKEEEKLASAGLKRAQTKTEKERAKKVIADTAKVNAEKKKLLGGTKGTGNRGRNLFIKRVDEAVSQIKKQISSRSTAIEANRAEYSRLKDLVSVAETEEREAKKSLGDALIDEAAFQQVKTRADNARKALEDFDTRTSYTKQSAELDDLRKQASQLGALGDQAARKFNPELWDKLARQRVLSGESLAVRQERMEEIARAGEQADEQAAQEASREQLKARQKQLLDRYKNSSRFERDFQNHARRAGVSKTPLSDIQKIRQGTLGIEDSEVSDIAAAAGKDFGDPFAYLNEVFFAEDNPGGVPLNPPPGVNKYETAQTYRQLQSLLQQGYTPRR